MAETVEITSQIQRRLAVELFNRTWDYMEKPDRTQEEDDEMLHKDLETIPVVQEAEPA